MRRLVLGDRVPDPGGGRRQRRVEGSVASLPFFRHTPRQARRRVVIPRRPQMPSSVQARIEVGVETVILHVHLRRIPIKVVLMSSCIGRSRRGGRSSPFRDILTGRRSGSFDQPCELVLIRCVPRIPQVCIWVDIR